MNYLEIEIVSSSEKLEEITNLLYVYGIQTLLEEENSLKFYVPEEDWGMIENLDDELKEKNLIMEDDFHVRKFEDKNWNEEWERSIEPVYIDDKIVIHTSWNRNDIENPEGKILVQIDPKMAFGTGHNETTQLMLEMMCRYMTGDEKTLLDYGCGTAILAIAGVKMGVKRALAIDIDPEAIENAKEYVEINRVKDKVTFYQSNISEIEESGFDVICANIIRSVIRDNIISIKSKLAHGGKLFLSGLLIEEEKSMVNTLIDNRFQVKKILHQAEWLGIYATHQ